MQIEKFVVSRNDEFMEGWPDLVRLKSGRFLVFYNECKCHPCRDNTYIAMRKSDDEGKTWSDAIHIGEKTMHGTHWNSIRVNELSDGRIILICDKILKPYDGEEIGGFFAFESTDGGDTWTDKIDTGLLGFCSDKVRELSDGSLLMCISKYNKDIDKNEILAHKSYDGGRTWKEAVVVASDDRYTFIEPAAIEMKDGTIAVFIRENSHKGYNGFIAFSDDKGESFYGLRELNIKAMHRPVVGYLANGNIFVSFREHPGGKVKYRNLQACILSDENVKDPAFVPEIIPLDTDNSPNADQGYTGWTELSDNTIYMVNYIVDDAPKAYIRGYRIKF